MGNIFTTQITCSGDAFLNRCFDCIGGRCVYVNELEHNLKCLDTSIKELESLKNDVITKIDIAERQGRKRLDKVQLWLSRVDIKVDKVKRLLKNRQNQIAKLCFGCCSTNYVSSYKFGKKVVKRLSEVNDLINQEKEFKELTKVALPEPMVEIPCEPTVGLEHMLDTVCRYLLEEETIVGVVGLYGESGVGKTALLMQVNNKICSETSRFDLVIWVAVSKPFTLGSIQNQIGKKIGFYGEEWMSKSLYEKAVDIVKVLKRKKFVLLLDDICEYINLTEIGVPLRSPNESKVVFTTPSERICGQMGAQIIVKVEPLGLKDSWKLFSQKVGEDTLNSDPEIKRLAEELAGQCGGLPHTIIRWARDMSCNRITQDWITVVESLRSPTLDSQEEIVENMAEIEEDDDECATTMGPDLADTYVFGSPITDQTLRVMRQYVVRKEITAIDRGRVALALVTEDGKDVKAREYVQRLKERYGDGATICIFYNATGNTLEFSYHKDWYGHLIEGLHPLKVKNGQWGVFGHMHDDSELGPRSSTGGIVYRGKNAVGDVREWLLAWDSPSIRNEANAKVFTEVRSGNHFHFQWSYLYHLLINSNRQRRDVWGGCVSSITLDDINGTFFKATLSLDSDD